jgi:hypothetical protein
MWVEAILGRADLEKVLNDFCPLRIALSDGGSVLISDPREVALIADVGLRMSVTVELHWPILGIMLPVSVRCATLDLKPEVLKVEGGDQLTFKFRLDDLDVSAFPAFVDRGLVGLVNKELESKHVDLSWGFTKTLSHTFDLPLVLASARAIDLRAAWGEVRITKEALVFAVSFHTSVEPRGASPAVQTSSLVPVKPSAKTPRRPDVGKLTSGRWSPRAGPALWAGGAAILAGIGVSALVYSRRRPKTLFDYLDGFWDA